MQDINFLQKLSHEAVKQLIVDMDNMALKFMRDMSQATEPQDIYRLQGRVAVCNTLSKMANIMLQGK